MLVKHLFRAASVAVLAVAASSAFAADLPAYEPGPAVAAPVPSFTWSGPYIGVQAGYAWGSSKISGVRSFDPEGFVVGAYAGYNVQLDNSPLVFGIETDFNYSDQDDSISGTFGGDRVRVKEEVKWTGATRGRIGYAFDRFLVYAAGGVAYADREISARVNDARGSSSKVAIGYTVGGGVEAAVTENVAVRGEYRYTDFGSDRLAGFRTELDEHRVMGGVAYKFDLGF